MTIPETCIQYTQVFTTFKFEIFIALAIGVLIGWWFEKIGK